MLGTPATGNCLAEKTMPWADHAAICLSPVDGRDIHILSHDECAYDYPGPAIVARDSNYKQQLKKYQRQRGGLLANRGEYVVSDFHTRPFEHVTISLSENDIYDMIHDFENWDHTMFDTDLLVEISKHLGPWMGADRYRMLQMNLASHIEENM